MPGEYPEPAKLNASARVLGYTTLRLAMRFAVACGLDESRHPGAKPLLERLQSDPDEMVRKRAKKRLGHL